MNAKRYSTEFKSSIVALYNEGRSANSLANEYHLAVQTVTGWVKKAQIIGTDVTGILRYGQVPRGNEIQRPVSRG
ncbi:transposase [Leuconostoc mesenteroides subsp. cremoris]|nr:transposase [Leuconostoc mesenteroides]ORI63962.1 transposase [Leuconostoc mesenteroides subsp. cremoris]